MLLRLTFRELLFDRLISVCKIAAVAGILSPLLLLFSLRYGVLEKLRDDLMSDPAVLSLTLRSSALLEDDFFADLASRKETGFVIPEILTLSALADMRRNGRVFRLSVVPTRDGDPVVRGSGLSFGNMRDSEYERSPYTGLSLNDDEIFMSEDAALGADVKEGDVVDIAFTRNLDGVSRARILKFRVAGIVKQRYVRSDTVFVNFDVLCALDDYRNGYEPPIFSDGSRPRDRPRRFAGFRLYAADFDSVIPLYEFLRDKKLNVSSKKREIENLKAVDTALSAVFAVIAAVALAGGAMALSGLAVSSVRSNLKNYMLLRLMGLHAHEICAVPLLSALTIATAGYALSVALYMAGSRAINACFAFALDGANVSVLELRHFVFFYAGSALVVLLISAASALRLVLHMSVADILRGE